MSQTGHAYVAQTNVGVPPVLSRFEREVAGNVLTIGQAPSPRPSFPRGPAKAVRDGGDARTRADLSYARS